jgi:hypothetical protein
VASSKGETLAVGAAANLLFWGLVSRQLTGASWPGAAAAIVTMKLAESCKPGPLLDLATLPGSVAASVLAQSKPCACQLKDRENEN